LRRSLDVVVAAPPSSPPPACHHRRCSDDRISSNIKYKLMRSKWNSNEHEQETWWENLHHNAKTAED
jgi:hypothetical protein